MAGTTPVVLNSPLNKRCLPWSDGGEGRAAGWGLGGDSGPGGGSPQAGEAP